MIEQDFIKRIIYTPYNDEGQLVIHPIQSTNKFALEKVAGRHDLLPKVAEFIDDIRPDFDHRYVLINALSAGEYFGPNKNSDFFEEKELAKTGEKAGHKTFLKAGVYKHHSDNKNKDKSSGKVILSEYNPFQHRVELIIRFLEREIHP